MANSIQYDYKILDRYSAPLAKIRKATDKMRGAVRKASAQVGKLGNKFKTAGDKMSSMQNAAAGLGAGLAIKILTQDSLKLADAMADIAKVSSLAGKPLMDMRFSLEKLGEQVGRPALGLAQIAFEGKKLGATDKELLPYVKTVGKMAIAFEIAESEAGNAIGQIRAKLGYGMGDIVKFGDSANELANTMATNGQNIIQITQRMAGTFKILEFPPGVAAGFAATADMLETSPELAASGMNMMMRKLSLIPGMTTKLMAAPVKTINEEMGKLAKLPVEKRIKKINKMFGAEAGRMVLKMTGNLALFNKAMETATQSSAIGSMDREMKNYLDRTSTKLKIAYQKISNSFRLLGDALLPFIVIIGNILSKFAKFAAKMSIAHPALTKLTTAVLLLGAAIPILMVPLGLLVSTFGTLMAAEWAVLWPILAIGVAVAAVAGSFIFWEKTNHPLIKTLKRIGSLVGKIIDPINRLFGVTDWGAESTNQLNVELEALGTTLTMIGNLVDFLLKPFETLLIYIKTNLEVGEKLLNLDFSGAFSALKGGFSDFGNVIGIGDAEVTSKKVMENYVETKSQNSQTLDVFGKIKVSADKGSKVVSTQPDFNMGTNMEFSH